MIRATLQGKVGSTDTTLAPLVDKLNVLVDKLSQIVDNSRVIVDKTEMRWPGFEPGSTAWQAAVLDQTSYAEFGVLASFCINSRV